MDDSIHGVIYFNLGAMMLIESFPRDTLLAFYASFAKVAPIRILMKIASEDKLPPGLPQNILTLSWIPQIPVLSKIKKFHYFYTIWDKKKKIKFL